MGWMPRRLISWASSPLGTDIDSFVSLVKEHVVRKFSLHPALPLVLAATVLLPFSSRAEERVWNIETLRDKRLFTEWIALCCSVIEKDEEGLARFCEKMTADMDEHVVFLNQPAIAGVSGASRHLILDRELDSMRQIAGQHKQNKELEERRYEELRFLLVEHVVALLSKNEYPPAIDEVFPFVDYEAPESIGKGGKEGEREAFQRHVRILGLIMLDRIYSARLDLAKNTFALLGDSRAYDKVVELGLLESQDEAMRYWATKIVGRYATKDAFKAVAASFRDKSLDIRIAALTSLGAKPKASKGQAGKLVLDRLRELMTVLAADKKNSDLNSEATVACESLIALFRKDIADRTPSEGRNGFGAVIASTVEDFLTLAEKWFEWWGTSPYAGEKYEIQLPPAK